MSQSPSVALTFEVGGDPRIAEQMLDILRDEQVSTTMFVVGKWIQQHPHLIKRMVADGHEIGNHSYSHPNMTELDEAHIADELIQTDQLVQDLTGQRAFPWFRPPYGAMNARIAEIVKANGYHLIQRDAVDGGHYPLTTTAESIQQRTFEQAQDQAVITYHIHNTKTLSILPEIIRELRRRGFQFVTLSMLDNILAYTPRRSDCRSQNIDHGYLQVLSSTASAWSMNLLDYGTREGLVTSDSIQLANTENYKLSLLVGKQHSELLSQNTTRHVLIINGSAELRFTQADTKTALMKAVAQRGEILLWEKQTNVAIKSDDACLILLIVG